MSGTIITIAARFVLSQESYYLDLALWLSIVLYSCFAYLPSHVNPSPLYPESHVQM
jgi:hypothetical protein